MIAGHPKLSYANLPTAIEALPRLSEALGGPNIYVKRDDCTGVGMGGNKCRKLDYLVADAIAHQADTILTVGGFQSNHVRQTAAYAARAGLACEAVVEPVLQHPDPDYLHSGNVLLDGLFGARLHHVENGADLDLAVNDLAKGLRNHGRRPYVIPLGGSNPYGSLGYVECADEIARQSDRMQISFTSVVLATGSGGTQAGLVAGFYRNGLNTTVQGFSVSPGKTQKLEKLERLTRGAFDLLNIDQPDDIIQRLLIDDGFYGDGYARTDQRAIVAIRLAAQTEALLLDPVYTGKAMAGLIAHIKEGRFTASDTILFLHTGGAPALFAFGAAFHPHPQN